MSNTKAEVLDLLKNYRKNQQRIALLRYELEKPAFMTSDEMIDALTFGKGEAIGSSEGHISNKTPYIALNYEERAMRVNEGVVKEIEAEIRRLERQQERVLHYISLLDKKDAEVIRMVYVDGMDNEQAAEKIGIAERTLRNRKVQAIKHLCEMLEYVSGLYQGVLGAE